MVPMALLLQHIIYCNEIGALLLLYLLQRCLAAAKAVFKSIAVGEGRMKSRYKQLMLDSCNSRFELVKGKALAQAEAATDAMLCTGASQIHTVSQGGYQMVLHTIATSRDMP